MPAISDLDSDKDIEVLVTGFGPFGPYRDNPSWLCTAPLHDTAMSLENCPEFGSRLSDKAETLHVRGRRIHVQAIMTPVAYSHVLDLVPRIHGNQPSSPHAQRWVDPRGPQPREAGEEDGHATSAQGNGQPFPHGYRNIHLPVDRKGRPRPFDMVVHVGVGSPGGIKLETRGHKQGYNKPDRRGELGPRIPSTENNKDSSTQELSAAELREWNNIKASRDDINTMSNGIQPPHCHGFGEGYDEFEDTECSDKERIANTVEWLTKELNVKHVQQSFDAGKYLCDFIYYCSLAERKRAASSTIVQFVHVPPLNDPYTAKDCREILQLVIWKLAQEFKKKI